MIKRVCVILFFVFPILTTSQNLETLPEHPRLLFTNTDCKIYKEKIMDDSLLSKLNDIILQSAEGMLALEPLGYNKTGKRLLGVSRTYLKRLFYLAYAYRITEDLKYARKAEEEMLTASSFNDWNPSHFLDVAEMTMALAIGYDWLFNKLSEKSKEKIKKAIIENGLKPSQVDKYNGWLKRKHNWNQVCNAGISFGAWAIYEDAPDLGKELIERAKKSIPLSQMDYEPDGVYVEGPSYWNYGTTFNTLFLEALEGIEISQGNFKINDGFMRTGEYYLNIFGTTGSFNYFDNGSGFSLAPAIFWFAMENQDASLLFHQFPLMENLKKINSKGAGNRIFPVIPIWLSQLNISNSITPNYLSWSGNGLNPVSFHRTSWEKDAIYIGIKGGKPGLNHGHMDAGNFVMDANGVRWVNDLGGHPYHKLESQGVDLWNRKQDSQRWSLIRYNNFGHSTLVINDQLQNVDAECPIVDVYNDRNKRGAKVDVSSAYSGLVESAERTVTIENNEIVKVFDAVKNNNEQIKVRWGIVTIDNITNIEGNRAMISQNGKNLKVQVIHPENAELRTFSLKPQNDYEDDNPGSVVLGFYTDIKPDMEKIIEVNLIPLKD